MPDDEAPSDALPLEVLDRDECLDLLAHHALLGRLALVVDGQPVIFPVNYLFDGDHVVFCSAAGTKLDVVSGGADVAFEIDGHSALHHSGWSVLVQGRAEVITDPAAVARLERGPLRPWAAGVRANWMRISVDTLSGRRIPET